MSAAVKPEEYKSYRTVSELAEYVGVTPRTIARWFAEGVIPTDVVRYGPTGTKLWSTDQASKVLEYRMIRLPSARFARRRIT